MPLNKETKQIVHSVPYCLINIYECYSIVIYILYNQKHIHIDLSIYLEESSWFNVKRGGL